MYTAICQPHNQAMIDDQSQILLQPRPYATVEQGIDHRLQVLLPADVQTHRCGNRTCVARAHRVSFRRGSQMSGDGSKFLVGMKHANPNHTEMLWKQKATYQLWNETLMFLVDDIHTSLYP